MIRRRVPRSLTDRPEWARAKPGEMPLHPNMIYSAFRVWGNALDRRSLTGQRWQPIGTGFLATIRSEADPEVRYAYAVTADHVIADQNRVEIQAPNPFGNGELYDPIELTDWRQPIEGLDLAVAPFDHANQDERTFAAVDFERQVLPANAMPALAATVYYVGLLAPLNRAMARSGTIGALNQEGIRHDGGYEYTAHLVDCRSYGGFSGSPCYLETAFAGLRPVQPTMPIAATWSELEPLGNINYFAALCGMFTQHLETDGDVVSRYGVGIMLRSDEIREALMSDELRKERREQDDRLSKEEPGGPHLRNASRSDPGDDEFDRFEDLTRQLVNTPKPKPEGGEPSAS